MVNSWPDPNRPLNASKGGGEPANSSRNLGKGTKADVAAFDKFLSVTSRPNLGTVMTRPSPNPIPSTHNQQNSGNSSVVSGCNFDFSVHRSSSAAKCWSKRALFGAPRTVSDAYIANPSVTLWLFFFAVSDVLCSIIEILAVNSTSVLVKETTNAISFSGLMRLSLALFVVACLLAWTQEQEAEAVEWPASSAER